MKIFKILKDNSICIKDVKDIDTSFMLKQHSLNISYNEYLDDMEKVKNTLKGEYMEEGYIYLYIETKEYNVIKKDDIIKASVDEQRNRVTLTKNNSKQYIDIQEFIDSYIIVER